MTPKRIQKKLDEMGYVEHFRVVPSPLYDREEFVRNETLAKDIYSMLYAKKRSTNREVGRLAEDDEKGRTSRGTEEI